MTIIGELLLTNLLAYMINLASGERSTAIAAAREGKLKEALEKEETLRKALVSTHSIRDEIRGACAELARNRAQLAVPGYEEPLWQLLSDEIFQTDLAEWLMAGAIEEGTAVKSRILQTMETALATSGASQEQIAFLKTGYFEAVDKLVFTHPVLARWRHQLSLDYLRAQVTVVRQRVDEAVGKYSLEKQTAALDQYCMKALAAWDIIDLNNLPEGDVQITTQKLLLRQLYMPLRIEIEPTQRGEGGDAVLARLEEQREFRRHREAGHLFADESERPSRRASRASVGECLTASRRLVVLGDPGGGKTTMLRWLATAYLLRHKGDAAFSQVPDTETLPSQSLVPVLIRCRDLGEEDLCRCFTDFLTQHLNKTELLPEEASVMRAVILDRIANSKALLLVDGLDEITNPQVRMMFCQELERTAVRYPDATIVVTSRIVGYRDMPYRMESGFEHGVIAELNRKDKDLFARRWVEVTEQHQTLAEKAKRVHELLDALHSGDRIERLTGNPMLLTTLALVKRKVGKLPNRRTKLYAEAVSVLLNWNPRLYQTIDEDEAIPQLEYLACEMCKRGVQRLTDDEVLDLLDRLRADYPNVRSIRGRDPQAFLALLEARSSILIKSGGLWEKNKGRGKPVWEFRHLTFQEYLAARALLDGRYPGRDKTKSLAEQVALLASKVEQSKRGGIAEAEVEVPESWREALRLLVADCKDDDVDQVLLAILNPSSGEEGEKTARPRTVLATLCLSDEPNVSEDTAVQIVDRYVAQVNRSDSGGRIRTSLSAAGVELSKSIWGRFLKQRLIHEYMQRLPKERHAFGSLWGMIEAQGAPEARDACETWLAGLCIRLGSEHEIERISAALVVMEVAFNDKAMIVPGLIEALFAMLPSSPPARFAAAWALGRLSIDVPEKWAGRTPVWRPTGEEVTTLVATLRATEVTESDTARWLLTALVSSKDARAVQLSIQHLGNHDKEVRRSAAIGLGRLGDKQAVLPLLGKLDDEDDIVRTAAITALGRLGDKQAVPQLLGKLNDKGETVRIAAITALGKLGDKQGVLPLLAKLDDEGEMVRTAVITALGKLGDKRAVLPLLGRLDDEDETVRTAAFKALGKLGDKRAIPALLAKLRDQKVGVGASAAVALHALGEPIGTATLTRFLTSEQTVVRRTAVRAYAQQKKRSDQQLLSQDFDAENPWLDPQDQITEARVTDASLRLGITPQEVRSHFEVMAHELGLKLAWKS